ncbi:transmembrane emp24 domain-containing protein 10-like [Ambystoma mexicanum]|uniref:transmembrane emp24 domain-containing protein 10-like n=1 Tax=Ambystoma mexicanum TaxID=8296 RepID=UPI0037E86F60
MSRSVLLLPLLLPLCAGLSFYLPPHGRKCLKDQIHRFLLVTGEYQVQEQNGGKTDLTVTDSAGNILYSKEDAKKGKFAFSTDDFDTYEVCFQRLEQAEQLEFTNQLVTLDIKHGVEAKNYEDLAKAEKLKPLELEVRRLEDLSESIVKDFSYMKLREEEMSDTNDSTTSRVLYFSVFSMFCLVMLGTWQVFYLRLYFKAKKLIE